jgi:hypothetical protein|tara:strand:- start:90 stop:332 length:243 start_codon:yes stop_codon:yes gene_type:complete
MANNKVLRKDNDSIPHIEWREYNEWYWWIGNKVFTELGLANRGKCCGCGCRHCPFEPKHSGSNTIKKELVGLIKTIKEFE